MQQGKAKEKMVKSRSTQLQLLNWLILHLHVFFSCCIISLITCNFCFACNTRNSNSIVVFHPAPFKYNVTIFYKCSRWRRSPLYEEYVCYAVGITQKEVFADSLAISASEKYVISILYVGENKKVFSSWLKWWNEFKQIRIKSVSLSC